MWLEKVAVTGQGNGLMWMSGARPRTFCTDIQKYINDYSRVANRGLMKGKVGRRRRKRIRERRRKLNKRKGRCKRGRRKRKRWGEKKN